MKKIKYTHPGRNGILFLGIFLLGIAILPTGCTRENMKFETKYSGEEEEQRMQTEQPATEKTVSGSGRSATETQLSGTENHIVEETETQPPEMEEPVLPARAVARPGERTVYNLLLTAIEPLGHTMYVWGGGWNEEDTAAGEEARSIGESPRWKEFFNLQDGTYNYKNTRYQIHDGLDCSGYIGWVVYNVFEDEDGAPGYVGKAAKMAEEFAGKGWGSYTPAGAVTDWKPGDIMSMKGHVWLSLGMCEDQSVVFLHASPPGVILSGTYLPDGSRSQAVELAEAYMRTYYPDWYAKYPECARAYQYLTDSGRMRWNETLADEERIQEMTAEEVLKELFD